MQGVAVTFTADIESDSDQRKDCGIEGNLAIDQRHVQFHHSLMGEITRL